MLFYGPPGLGKTSLAHIVANEMGGTLHITAGPIITIPGDLAAILSSLKQGDVLFIDEIHRLSRPVEEILYPAMEDFALDLMIGKGPSARNIRLKLPHFTVVGATTRLALISAPLRARFGSVYRLDYYEQPVLEQIIRRGARLLNVAIDPDGLAEIARRGRGTPRVALRLLRRVRDYAQVRGNGSIDGSLAAQALSLLDVDPLGLDDLDRRVLKAIIDKFNGGPVGLDTITASISEESDTIMDGGTLSVATRLSGSHAARSGVPRAAPMNIWAWRIPNGPSNPLCYELRRILVNGWRWRVSPWSFSAA